ncbi:MAG TPA: M20/M25/M40 family metallo-hydrolase [Gaiellales bacterium]|nr:M20/M25/M40 family metallo-hydrolase [Gaiellales bacterium]
MPDAVATALRVRDAAAADLDLMLRDLARWVAHDSPSGALPELDALAAEIARTLSGYGSAVELVPAAAGLHVHAVLEGPGRARVALLCHHDTVFPLGTAARRPLAREGDRLIGPGVADMKGGLVVAAHAARLLATRARPFARLELVSVPDEEIRSQPIATQRRLAGFDAVLCMECGRPGGAVVAARKGGRWLDVVAHGRSAHAGSEPEHGRNAVIALARELPRIAALDGARQGLTLHVTRMHGGDVLNSIPGEARATIDMRGWHDADLDWAEGQLLRVDPHRDVTFSTAERLVTPPLERTPAVAALALQTAALGDALGSAVPETFTGGVSDGCWTAGEGLPTLDGLGPVGALDHSPDEYIEIPSLAQRCGLVAGLVAAIDAGLLRTQG